MTPGADRVLAGLRRAEDQSCSGQSLSDELGVSRNQVWKHVQRLRRRGYGIEGEPGGGYRLIGTPDRLYPEEIAANLETTWLARSVEHLDETESTNDLASERGREGAPAGHTVIAERQTAGRGRLGRSFYSPAYLNLYTSILLRPTLSTHDAPTLIHATAVGCANAIAETLSDRTAIEIKWPNDILLGSLKTCGILMEMSAEATRLDFAVLGIGVNLNVDREDFPDEFRHRATSLRTHSGTAVDRIRFAQTLFRELETSLERHAAGGFEALRGDYEDLFRMTGQEVRVRDLGGGERVGTVLGIASDGALLLESSPGRPERIVAGDVTLAKAEFPHE